MLWNVDVNVFSLSEYKRKVNAKISQQKKLPYGFWYNINQELEENIQSSTVKKAV